MSWRKYTEVNGMYSIIVTSFHLMTKVILIMIIYEIETTVKIHNS